MLIATNGMVFVEEIVSNITKSGIILPETRKKTTDFCTGVIHALDKTDEVTKPFEVGDTILYPTAMGVAPVKLDGKELLVFGAGYISGIIGRQKIGTPEEIAFHQEVEAAPDGSCIEVGTNGRTLEEREIDE